MGKSALAGLSGLKLRLHTKCDPKHDMPAFNPSCDSASSLFPVGIVVATHSKLPPSPLLGDEFIASGGPSAHLGLDVS